MELLRSAITDATADAIRVRGYDVAELMRSCSFTDVLFLLHRSRLPSPAERRLLDAILIAASDHGPGAPSALAARVVASGNRRAPEAAVAAGVLSLGDAHGGAGEQCMSLLQEGLARVRDDDLTNGEAAAWLVERAQSNKQRLPGFGHRTHAEDPRATALFAMARASGRDGAGVAFIEALRDEIQARIRPLPINVDGALAAVLLDLGFPPLAARFFFIIGRTGGITAQVAEELERERPMRMRIPVEYDGPAARDVEAKDDDDGSSS